MKYLIRKKYKLIYLFNKMFKEKFDKKLEFDWSKSSKRFTIINTIIKKMNYEKYLEIGCFKDEAFEKIKIKTRVGVDPVSGGNIRLTSDNFFSQNKEKFDIVFIDGLHIYEQVLKDINNSLEILNEDGVILLHDCLPIKLRDQMIPRSHEKWNGDVWKSIVNVRTNPNLDTYTCLADEGIGIIFKRSNKNILSLEQKNFKKLKFSYYFYNHKELMNPVTENQVLSLFS